MCDLLPYETQIFLDLNQNDGLVIMAEGLGIERIFLNFIKLYCDPSHLVMIINTNEAEEKYYLNKLKEDNVDYLPTKITNETHSVAERQTSYMKGGCFFITSRILVVDLLTDRVPIDLINGILVAKAHNIVDNCQETFILRLFRQKNKVFCLIKYLLRFKDNVKVFFLPLNRKDLLKRFLMTLFILSKICAKWIE
jgi:DNA excision repair protein ERCC-4